MRFSYAFIKAADINDLIKQLTTHGQEGYRFVPYTPPYQTGGEILAIMEKADEDREPGQLLPPVVLP